MDDAETVRRSFAAQSEWCRQLGSPFTAQLCDLLGERLDGRGAFGRRVLAWPNASVVADALALRCCGALHALSRSGREPALTSVYPPAAAAPAALWSAVAAAIERHDAALAAFLDSPPQTNEVARSSVLLGGLLHVAAATDRPLSLLEIGASAGLNQHFDRYAYDLGAGRRWGNPRSPVQLACAWSGNAPPLGAPLAVAERAACDLRPLDPSSPADRARLLAYVWPDQAERMARVAAALDLAAASGLRVAAADAGTWLAQRLAVSGAPGTCRVLFHSVVWQYLPEATRATARAAIDRAAEAATVAAPFAWLRMEADDEKPGAGLRLAIWPAGTDRLIARADFHGRWAAWR